MRFFAQRDWTPMQAWAQGYDDTGHTAASVRVNHDTALTDDAVMSAVSLLAGDIAGLPLKAYVTDGELTQPLDRQPSWIDRPDPLDPAITAFAHKQQVGLSVLLAGEGFVMAEPNVFNPLRLTVLNPVRVRVIKPHTERLFEVMGRPNFDEDWQRSDVLDTFSSAQIVHIPYLLRPGKLHGLSPIDAQKGNISISLALRKWVENFFGKGGQVAGFVTLPKDAPETALPQVESAIKKRLSGWRNAGIIGVLSGGAGWTKTGLSLQDADVSKLWNRQLEMVARIYGIPPFMVGSQEPAGIAYASTESRQQEYVVHCLSRYTKPIEEAYSRLVPGDGRRQVPGSNTEVRFNFNALLRGDVKSRMEAYQIALNTQQMVKGEVRALENRKPLSSYSQEYLDGPDGFLKTPNNSSAESAEPAPPTPDGGQLTP